MNFTNEQLTKAKQAKSAEELLAMAKASGIEMTDSELVRVSGGNTNTESQGPKYPIDTKVKFTSDTYFCDLKGTVDLVVWSSIHGQYLYTVEYDERVILGGVLMESIGAAEKVLEENIKYALDE